MCSAFVVKNFQPVGIFQCVLTDKDAPQAGFSLYKEIAHEIFFNVDVLVIQLAEGLLIDIVTYAHQREFKETGHGRGKAVGLFPVYVHIQQNGPPGQFIQNLLCLHKGKFPNGCRRLRGKRLNRKLGHQTGFFFGKQDFKNAEQHV